MLRVTQIEDGARTVFIVEGRLTSLTLGPLAELVDGLPASAESGQSIVVDLMGVTSIDSEGKLLLKKLHKRGASFRARGCLNRAIVEAITCCAPEPAGAGAPTEQQAKQTEAE